jgi:arylsulfatase A-like enzyme
MGSGEIAGLADDEVVAGGLPDDAPTAIEAATSDEATAAQHRRDRRSWLTVTAGRGAVMFGLAGVAITQPVLDLFGKSPEFFVAGRYIGASLVWFVLVVALVPASIAAVLLGLAELANPWAATQISSAMVGGLTFLFGLVLTNAVGIEGTLSSVTSATLLAALAVFLERRFPPTRTFFAYLALGNVLFVAQFVWSPSGDLLGSSTADAADLAWVEGELDAPVVMLVLDELPVTTLMNADGTINSERYPNFARLAKGSTWYRNASSHSPMTHMAVPTLLTGTMPRGDALPTLDDYPENFFTMFGDDYPVHGYESVTHLCPDTLCQDGARGDLTGMFKDAAVVFGHQSLPTDVRDQLPDIGHAWGNFRNDDDNSGDADRVADPAITDDDPYGRWHAMDLNDTSPRAQIRVLDQMASQVDSTPSLHLAHVAVPHYPWVLTPEGELTQTLMMDREPPEEDHELLAEQAYQLQSLQTGAVDRVIGDFMNRLEATGAWDDALVVVVSDHGRGMSPPPDFGRKLTEANREELLRMPLFVKAPGQTEGEMRDDPAILADVLPTILDLLGAETDVDFAGRSLVESPAQEADVDPEVESEVGPALDLAERNAEAFPHGSDWLGLAALGEHGDLVGTSVADVTVGDPSPSGLKLAFEDAELFGDLPAQGNRWPQLLVASLSGVEGDRPPELLVEVNGTLAGMLGGYEHGDDGWTMVGMMAPLFERGANEVTAYEVDRSGNEVVLRPVPPP